MKRRELIVTRFSISLLSVLLLISSRDKPDTKEIYIGIKGSTHGDIKDIIPAAKAANKDTPSIRATPPRDRISYIRQDAGSNTTLSIGVASFSLRFYLYAGDTFLAQAKACYSTLWLNDKVAVIAAGASEPMPGR